jgi:hypothetical protein
VFNVYSYLTTTHISVYEVEQGTIAENNIYNGLIVRDEKIYNAYYSGYLNYYVKESTKVSSGNLICSVDENGSISGMIEEASSTSANIDSSDIADIREQVYEFQNSYDPQSFYSVYSFKDDIDSTLSELLSMKALEELSTYTSTSAGAGFHQIYSSEPGILLYYTDGFEGVTTDNFTADMFDESIYSRQANQLNTSVSAGSPLYKLVTSELWNIIIPVDSNIVNKLEGSSVIQIRFVKDNKKMYVNFDTVSKGGQDYLILSLKSSMIRYVKERYLEIELLLSEESGLKIPNSSITEKEFYTIPIEYFMKGGDSDESGLLVVASDEDGNSISEFITPTIYYETDDYYYVDSEDISAGDVIQKSNSSSTYVVGSDTASLKGVYNINKGYAVFKQIDILYQNNEYSIIQTGTTYGIALYDHIALDGDKVTENELIK